MAALVLAIALATLAGCYPGGPESFDDIGLVLTFKNPDTDFTGLRTYAMADTVVVLDADNNSATPLDRQFNPTILSALQTNMASHGFTRVSPDSAAPDLWLAVGAVQSEVWISWQSWGYWGGYYPPGWGGGYYPPQTGVASFDQGSIVWQLLDVRGFDPANPTSTPQVIWLGGINGAIRSSNATNHGAIENGIDQGFAQSPYITAAAAAQLSGPEALR